MIDTHCHLNFKAFKNDLKEVINRAEKAGVTKIIIPGAKIHSSQVAVDISSSISSCFAATGIHPHHTEEFLRLGKESTEDTLLNLAKSPKTAAIGEIGMDYYSYKGYPDITADNKKSQQELFEVQLDIAMKLNLPVILHCREAHDDQISILRSFNYGGGKSIRGVFHCFGGEKKHLTEVLNMGFYVGFDGNITYPENIPLRELVAYTPADRLLLETDAPFLTPVPHRGTRNEPSFLTFTAQSVAESWRKDTESVGEITSQNALKLFRL